MHNLLASGAPRRSIRIMCIFASCLWMTAPSGVHAEDVPFAVRAGGYLNEAGALVEDVVLLIENGKITAIGKDVTIPEDCLVLDRPDAILSPGFVDAHVTLGTMQRTGEAAHSIESKADAADLFNRFHHDFDRAVRAGITTAVLAPASSHIVGGSTAVVKTAGSDSTRRLLGHGPLKLSLTARAFTIRRTPTSIQGGLDDLRRIITEAKKPSQDNNNSKSEKRAESQSPLTPWAQGTTTAIVDVDGAAGLDSLARFHNEQDVRCIALHARYAAERLDDVRSLEEPVILGCPTFGDPRRFTRTPAILHEAGIPFAMTCNPPKAGPEMLRVGTAIAIQQGLPPAAAFASITTTPAEIVGVSDHVGSLTPGKDADFIVFSGHPMDLTSRIIEVFVDGERVYRAPDKPASNRGNER
ncbi:MAG: amidohydrolase family protein [Phycisphaerae bacterium]